MQDIEQLKETIKELLDSQRLAVLATQGEGPYGSLVAFAATEDIRSLIFGTTRSTRKYSNLLKNRAVAMVIDTRTNQTADFADASAITALGDVQEVDDHERQELAGIYLAKHPYLREFVLSPTTSLFRVRVKTYIMVNRFQNVQELHISE